MSAYWIRGLAHVALAIVIVQVVLLEARYVPSMERFSGFGHIELSVAAMLGLAALLLARRNRLHG